MSIQHFDARVSLGHFPTPVEKLARLSAHLGGPDIYIKRDDLTGLALGGNKTRKLEFILADALKAGADTIVTAGAAQSNHCRQTAAAAAKLGLECHLVLGGQQPEYQTGNLLLDRLFGSHIHFCDDHRKGEDIPAIVERLKAQDKKPYVVPYGGSNRLGALAFAAAMTELKTQTDTAFSHIVFASSSGGTHAGMMLGSHLAELSSKILGIAVEKEATQDESLKQYIARLGCETAQYADMEIRFTTDDVLLNEHYIGQGYGILSEAEREAIGLLARLEGILLDPVYTGRAMAALIDMVKQRQFNDSDNLLFWHTGGAPALFAYADQL